jgi:hypothetical protein
MPIPTTPIPNALLDEVMPTLGDTPWRLLCVVVRQTLGWQADSGRKERDWLSHAQLKARTGRHSAAVCAAIEELVQRGLIKVEDEQGRPLVTPQARRRARSRVFYRLHPDCLKESAAQREFVLSKSYVKDKGDNSTRLDKPEVPPNQRMISESAFHNAKTTKENQTKNSFKDNSWSVSENEMPSNARMENVGERQGEHHLQLDAPDYKSASDEMASAEAVSAFIEHYQALYLHYRPGQSVPAISNTHRELLQKRLTQHSPETLLKWLPLFFASSFGYVRRRNYSLDSFFDSLHVLQMAQRSR